MPALDANDLVLLRGDGHRSQFFASFLKPATLWSMRLNDATPSQGDISIAFDGGSGSDFSAVEALQTLWVGTTPGANDVDTVRIRSISSGDAGVTGTIGVAPNGILWADDMYLTVKHDYRLDARYPYIDPATEVFYKDRDIARPASMNDVALPVGVLDLSQRAGFIRDGELVFWVDASNSYAMEDGASISSYALSCYPTTGVTVDFNTSTGIGKVIVTSLSQEYYWLKLTVTDSNSRTQVTYRCIFAHDPDATGSTYPHNDFSVSQLTGDWERGGWYTQLVLRDNASLTDIPDGTFTVLWKESVWDKSESLPVLVRDTNRTYVNPRIDYDISFNGVNYDATINFHAGVMDSGAVVANGTNVAVDIFYGASVQAVNNTTTDSQVTITATFNGVAAPTTAKVENQANTIVIVATQTVAVGITSATATYPSPLYVFPRSMLVGYVRRENLQSSLTSGADIDTIEITTIEDMLRNHYMFSIPIEAHESPNEWHEYAEWLTIGRACHFVWRWHSTLFEVADVVGLMDNTDARAAIDFEDGTLYTMPDNVARNAGIRAHVVCNKHGQIYLTEDVQLMVDADRAGLDTVATFSAEDLGGEVGRPREQEPRTAFVYASGLAWDGTSFTTDENNQRVADVDPYCAVAPFSFPNHGGEGTTTFDRQVITSQDHINKIAGRVYAKENNPYPEVRVRYHGDYLDVLDIHIAEFWEMDVATGDWLKELAIPDLLLIPRNINAQVDVNDGVVVVNANFEPEADGQDGIATECPSLLPIELGTFDIPTIDALPGAIITGNGSVYYLPPDQSSWTLRTAEAVEDLFADPFWRTAQSSSASTDAIIIRCGAGYIKRSTDGGATWSTVTPGTDPPNDEGDSPAPTVGNVTFIEGEGSVINQNTFVFLATWQNGGGADRTWIWYTTDNFSTGSWLYLGVSGSGCVTPGVVNDISGASNHNNTQDASERTVVFVDTDKFVFVYADGGNSYVQAATVDGEDITFGTRVQTGESYGFGGHICKVATNKFAVCHYTNVAPAAYGTASAQVGTVSGTTITLGTNYPMQTTKERQTLTSTQAADHIDIACPDGTTLVAIMKTTKLNASCVADASTHGYHILTGTIASTDITWDHSDSCTGPEDLCNYTTLLQGLTENSAGRASLLDMGDGSTWMAAYLNTSDDSGVISVGSGATTTDTDTFGTYDIDDLMLCRLSTTSAVVVYDEDDSGSTKEIIYARYITLTAGTINLGSAQTIIDVATAFHTPYGVVALDSTNFVYLGESTQISSSCSLARHCSLSLGVLTVEQACDRYFSRGTIFAGATTSTDGFVAVPIDGTNPNFRVLGAPLPCGSSSNPLGLGISLAKGTGDYAWVTLYSTTGHLQLHRIDLSPSLAIGETFNLCAATAGQVSAKTFIAYPFSAFTADGDVYVYGRLNDPFGTGDNAHIIITENAGATWNVVIDDWDTDHCGSLREFLGLSLFAVRNTGAAPKLYGGTATSLTLKSTSNLAANVNPHGMTVDFIDGTVLLCSGAGNAVMVVGSAPPYQVWNDLTSDHGTSTGIDGVEIL